MDRIYFTCTWPDCGLQYQTSDTLRVHQRRKHGVEKVKKLLCPVAECDQRLGSMVTLCAHVREQHDAAKAIVEQLHFDNYEQFTEWKAHLEKTTASCFVQHEGTKSHKDKKYMYFYCNRSGQSCKPYVAKARAVRSVKSQDYLYSSVPGLCKIDSVCSAHIFVTIDTESNAVKVDFCAHHVGHSIDFGHLRLSTELRLEIAALLHQGVTVTKIMDTVRDRVGQTQTLQRDLLLCRQDIHNVKRQYNIGGVEKHADDHLSVDTWIEEMSSMGAENPVLLYKPQGMVDNNSFPDFVSADFILCLQTSTQRQFMLQFGTENIVCLDSTHGTTQYDFNLVTVMVIDDFGEGNPVAFMICNREDEQALRAFFLALKAKLPPDASYTASHIMTDDASQYYNAWTSVFGPAVKRLCTWHVDRSWRKAIKQHVPATEDQVEIYHMLRSLLQELNEQDFECCLSAFMQHLSTVAPNFATYFTTYCSRTTEWAYCYRVGTQANTNMYIESFHNVLKTVYMGRQANRRVDSLISILLRVARDKAFERLIKVEKQSHSKKLQDINKRHIMIMSVLPSMVGAGWNVPSQSTNVEYCVLPIRDTCSCRLHCNTCHCCPHMYECSCVDFAVHATVCKHVHTIHYLRCTNDADSSQSSSVDTAVVVTSNVISVQSADVEDDNTATESPSASVDTEALRSRLLSKCQQVMAEAALCDDSAALQCALKHIQTAEASLRAIARRRATKLPTARRLPANKKLERQLRFFSTRKKRRPIVTKLQKPSADKVNAVKNALMTVANDTTYSSLNDILTDVTYDAASYCVDTEEVMTTSPCT